MATPATRAAPATPAKIGTWRSLARAVTNWRFGAVTVLSFSSGLPLGLTIKSIPFWMQQEGIDIKSIGLITLAQAPYALKFLWSPLMDRFAPRRGRKRAWILVGQLLLAASVGALALVTGHPSVAAICTLTLIVAFSSSTQDIAIDAYTVEVLRKEEQGVAVGARVALYRAAMYVSGAIVVWMGPKMGWGPAFVALGAVFLLLVPVTLFAPEPEALPRPPASLRDAVWDPFVSFFRHPRAMEIVCFLFLYKLSNNVAEALVSPFLGQLGFDPAQIGPATGAISLVATILGTVLGGIASTAWGVGRALWIFGVVQALAHGGYAVVAQLGVNIPVLYAATAIEAGAIGLGTAAFNVLLLRITHKRFSATQYALFSSIFALNRTVAGPPAGVLIDALGWRDFFLVTIPIAIPGMLMLHRFAPWRARDIPEAEEVGDEASARVGSPLPATDVARRGLFAAALSAAAFYLTVGVMSALQAMHRGRAPFDLARAFGALLRPVTPGDWLDVIGPGLAGLVVGVAWAAYLVARHGIARRKPRA